MTKALLLPLLALVMVSSCKTRSIHSKPTAEGKSQQRPFTNQGEQENYWAKQLFENHYKPQKFKKHKGTIRIIDERHVQYGDVVIILDNTARDLIPIFTNGILYPQLISEGNISISNVEEQPFLTYSAKIKRFKFLLWSKRVSNPVVYFFELTNNKATLKATLENFIKGAKLTFLKQGWVQI